jgi:hypothetical protein
MGKEPSLVSGVVGDAVGTEGSLFFGFSAVRMRGRFSGLGPPVGATLRALKLQSGDFLPITHYVVHSLSVLLLQN